MADLQTKIRVLLEGGQALSETDRLRQNYQRLTGELTRPLKDIGALRELQRMREASAEAGRQAQSLRGDLDALRAQSQALAEAERALAAEQAGVARTLGQIGGARDAAAALAAQRAQAELLRATLNGAGVATQFLADEQRNAAGALREVQRQAGQIDRLQALTRAGPPTAAAVAEIGRLSAALQRAGVDMDALGKEQDRLRDKAAAWADKLGSIKALGALERDSARAAASLETLHAALRAAGVDTAALAAEEERLAAAQALRQVERERLAATRSGAPREVAALREQIAAADRAAAAGEKQSAQAARLAERLQRAGVDTAALSAEQDRLAHKLALADDAMRRGEAAAGALATARERAAAASRLVAQQAEAAALREAAAISRVEVAQEQALARRAALQAAAAARQGRSDTAFDALGLRSSAQIAAEIGRVQAAVSALRASTAGPTDLARALEAARARTAALRAEMAGLASADAAAGPQALQSRLAGVVTAALAAREALEVVRSIVHSGLDLAAQENRFSFVFGSVAQGRRELDFANRTADRLGLSIKTVAEEYAELGASARGSGLTLQQQREIFTGIAEAAATLHLSNDQVGSSFRAISQIMSKGVVQSQEWKLQLEQALPIAADAGRAAIGRTAAEFEKLLAGGELRAADFLPKFAATLRAQVAEAVGKAAESDQAALQRLENRWERFKQQIASSGLLAELSRQVEMIGRELDRAAESGELQRVATGIAQALGDLLRVLATVTQVLVEHRDVVLSVAAAYATVKIGGLVADAGRLAIALAFGRQAAAAAEGLSGMAFAARGGAAALALLGTAVRAIPFVGVAAAIAAVLAELAKLIDSHRSAAAAARDEMQYFQRLQAANSEYASVVIHTRDEIESMTAAQRSAYSEELARSALYSGAAAAEAARNGNREVAAIYSERLAMVQAAQVAVRAVDAVWEADERRLATSVVAIQRGMLAEMKTHYAELVTQLDKANKDLEAARARREAIAQQYAAINEKLAPTPANELARREKQLQRELQAKQQREQSQAEGGGGDGGLQVFRGGERSAATVQQELQGLQQKRAEGPSLTDLQRYVDELRAATSVAEKSLSKADFTKAGLKEAELQKALSEAADAGSLDTAVVGYMAKQAEALAQNLAGVQEKAASGAVDKITAQMEQIKQQVEALKSVDIKLTPLLDPHDLDAIRAEIEKKLQGITVTVVPATKADQQADQALGTIGLPAKAAGGLVTGPGTGTSDSVLMWGSHGEYMLRAAAVQHYGLAALDSMNSMRMPRFAAGGLVSLAGAQRSALSGFAPPAVALPAPGAAGGRPVAITLPGIGTYQMTAAPRVVDDLVRAAAKFGGVQG
ncbi:MAG: tape measure protein [Rhodocyclaceae bacterium]|nr:tape measure protein [Rhodocyclaceae bacterium]